MNIRGEFKPSTIIMAVLLFLFIVSSGLSLINLYSTNVIGNFDTERINTFNTNFNQSVYTEVVSVDSKVQTGINNITDVSSDQSGDNVFAGFGVAQALLTGGWAIIQNLLSIFAFIPTIFTSMADFFAIPKYLAILASLALTFAISFTILSFVFNRSA